MAVSAEGMEAATDSAEDLAAAAERHAAALAALDEAIEALERLRDSADWFTSSQWMCVAAEVVALKGMRAMVRGSYPGTRLSRSEARASGASCSGSWSVGSSK